MVAVNFTILQFQQTNVAAAHDSLQAKVTFLSCYFFKPVQLIARTLCQQENRNSIQCTQLVSFILRNISRSYFYGTTIMESRSKTIEYPLIGKPLDDSFSTLRLPTNKDVLRRVFYHVEVYEMVMKKC